MTSTESTAVACECSYYETSQEQGGDDTGCNATTVNTFAPGHDAKLKSFLIRNHGADIWDTRGVGGDSYTVARRFGFEAQVVAGIDKAKAKGEVSQRKAADRAAAKAARATRKPKKGVDAALAADEAFREALADVQASRNARIEAEEHVTPTVKAKVGRWVKEGVVVTEPNGDQRFVYADAKGEPQRTTKYTLV